MTSDLPTLRLVTLRRLVAVAIPPIVFDVTTPVATIAAQLARMPGATAVIVDADGVLRGTLGLADARAAAGMQVTAERAMATTAPVLEPEHDAEEARRAMRDHAADRVVVAAASGALLGVLTDSDLERALTRRAS